MKNLLFVVSVLIFIIFLILVFGIEKDSDQQDITTSTVSTTTTGVEEREVVADNLSVPWDIAFLPDGSFLVTERTGSIVRITEEGETRISRPQTVARGEGGLLGLVLHPQFEENNFLYLYETYQSDEGLTNRVVRYVFDAGSNTLSDEVLITGDIPGASYHDGGRIRFGPPTSCESGQADCYLYVTTGDAGDEDSAQDLSSLAGKILRIHDDGRIPNNNPFVSNSSAQGAVWSYGHRNPQGITWDDDGNMWSSEHGRSGFRSGYDELNLIVPGGNYGWPVIQGSETAEGMIAPVLHSGADTTWAPASLSSHDGYLYWGGLRGEALYRVDRVGRHVSNLTRVIDDLGRIRTVVVGPDDQTLYLTTSNTDGRGNPQSDDDKLIRYTPSP